MPAACVPRQRVRVDHQDSRSLLDSPERCRRLLSANLTSTLRTRLPRRETRETRQIEAWDVRKQKPFRGPLDPPPNLKFCAMLPSSGVTDFPDRALEVHR